MTDYASHRDNFVVAFLLLDLKGIRPSAYCLGGQPLHSVLLVALHSCSERLTVSISGGAQRRPLHAVVRPQSAI